MLEAVNGLPSNVVGIIAKGKVTSVECRTVLRPLIRAAARKHEKLRLYYELQSRYPGAGWDELDLGLQTPPTWERAAVVSNTAWVRQVVQSLLFFMAKEVRVFDGNTTADAKAWICSDIAAEEPSVVPFRAPGPEIELPPQPGQPARRGTHLYKRP